MECRHCGSELERPGDYCLVCRGPNADAVVLDLDRERATVTALWEDERVGSRTVTTTPEDGEDGPTELRNFAGQVVDEVRRKRPETVYVAGDREVVRAVRGELRHEFYRVPADDPVGAAIERRDGDPLEVVEATPAEKLGGAHSTLIGGRDGKHAVETVAAHPHVKKLVPGPITNGATSEGGLVAKATRADEGGNVRLLLCEGASVQENRVVTTAPDRETGERVRADLNEALTDEGLR